ncbi:hypothetical protein [Streptomyces sp. 35G-GA-8]|uniref:hypothetical protein n=1 Tax=Streptomyces sp. 35G-GA-8 TaxID=2939434 RepID=UPI00201EADF2|nr:hypothetical protein [Streptomyces sp. 35G-GA-8]MCL7379634.1 hypothetical protein [Streptomyces sp. 35G-GA-8]
MTNIDENRRTPGELAMLEILEPDMKEVIVEGRGDQAILRWFFTHAAPETEIDIFAVKERVLIDEEVVSTHGYNTGERGSVLTVAEIVNAAHPEGNRLRFVADRDLSSLGLDGCPQIGNVFYTDFASMELYFFSEKPIGKMLSVALRAPARISPRAVIEAVTPVLVSIFTIRSILRSLPTPKKLASKVIDSLKFTETGSTLDVREAFSKSCQGANIETLVAKYSGVEIASDLDVRHFIRGHDISAVLVRYISSLHGQLFREDRRHLAQAAAMEICLTTCLELADFEGFALFKSLKDYVSTRP